MTRRLVRDYRTESRAYQPSHAIQVSYGLPFSFDFDININWRLLAALAGNIIGWGLVVAFFAQWW